MTKVAWLSREKKSSESSAARSVIGQFDGRLNFRVELPKEARSVAVLLSLPPDLCPTQ